MKNPCDTLSEMSVDKPKTVIAVAVIGILALSSFAQYIVFDDSEDAFIQIMKLQIYSMN